MLFSRRFCLAVLMIVLSLSIAGCGGSKLADIQDHPEKYEDKEVTLEGKVDRVLVDIYKGPVYLLKDRKGVVLVLSKDQVPPGPKTKVTVTGVIKMKYDVRGKVIDVLLVENK